MALSAVYILSARLFVELAMLKIHDPLIGVVLGGRYRIDDVIARGGMAMVYYGTDIRLDRTVAIKVMHAHLTQDETYVERFKREAVHAARLSHPNLVAIHDQSTDGEVVYLVMEYLPSVTLRRELKHRGRLSPRQAIVVCDAILSALEVVHGAGLIHRDLKPDNVLLGTDGQIKLADFGLARSVSAATTTKTLIGTVGYVAPELVTREGADARTDLYTLGIMLYEMLTGTQPYTDDVPIQVAYRHVHDSVPPPSQKVEGIGAALDALVLWATSRDPEDRPASASDMRMALGEVRAELSTEELDYGAEVSPSSPGAEPVLAATVVIADNGESDDPSDGASVRLRTDEIPYLESEQPVKDQVEHVEIGTKTDDAAKTEVPRSTKNHPGKPRIRRWKITAALIMAFLCIGCFITWTVLNGIDRTQSVPQISTGANSSEAIDLLKDAGFTPRIREEYSSSVPAGKVLSTQPTAGTELEPESDVTLVVSKGEELFGTPKVVGSAEEEARNAIAKSNLAVGTIERQYSAKVPAGQVISQSVKAGEQVPQGTTVDFTVSRGPRPIDIPNVVGLDYETGFGKMTRLGFLVAKEEEFSNSVPKGKIISQWPHSDKARHKGDLMILHVSKGKQAPPKSSDAESEDDTDED